jgi:hypothetical protein
MHDVEVFQQFPPDEAPTKTASNWYEPGVDGAVKVPAKFPPKVVVTVFRVSQVVDPRCLYIKVTVLPTGTAGNEIVIPKLTIAIFKDGKPNLDNYVAEVGLSPI